MTAHAAAEPWLLRSTADTMQDSDQTLVDRTKAGDIEAFSELVRRHEKTVYNLAYRFMREPALAEDMAQEAFLKAFRLLGGFRGDSSFSTWLYRVTSSVCLTELSRRKRRGEVELEPAHMAAVGEEGEPVDDAEQAELIRRCVRQLPERYATVITLYYLEEIPYEQIAEVMEIPMGTLKTWMHRARNALRTIVEKELGENGLQLSEGT